MEFLSKMSPKERAELADILRRLRDFYRKHDAPQNAEETGLKLKAVMDFDAPGASPKPAAQKRTDDSSQALESLCGPN